MSLAAKVVAHVTSPEHKKLLNLTHNWLTTLLPHCLAKIHRVSFGLLNDEDCKRALAADALVPRSRLKLAVPFIGKDVPSKSSEFAHPDIIIGLTVLAYRCVECLIHPLRLMPDYYCPKWYLDILDMPVYVGTTLLISWMASRPNSKRRLVLPGRETQV